MWKTVGFFIFFPKHRIWPNHNDLKDFQVEDKYWKQNKKKFSPLIIQCNNLDSFQDPSQTGQRFS